MFRPLTTFAIVAVAAVSLAVPALAAQRQPYTPAALAEAQAKASGIACVRVPGELA